MYGPSHPIIFPTMTTELKFLRMYRRQVIQQKKLTTNKAPYILGLILSTALPSLAGRQDGSDFMLPPRILSNVTAYLLVTKCRSFISERSNQTCGQALTIAL